jgi:1-acyl-sn-glycerol-3-phosphate acyltransferase
MSQTSLSSPAAPASATLPLVAAAHDTPLLQQFPPLFRNRNFILLWLGYVVANLGDRIHAMVMLTLVAAVQHHREAGTQQSAQITIMMLLPFVLFGPLTGILADRFSRRGIMIVSDLARVGLVIVVRVFFLAIQSRLSMHQAMGVLFTSEFILASFGTAFTPARTALLPNLVHPSQLLRANSMTSAAGTIASLIGFIVGGALVGWDPSVHLVMFIDAAIFAGSAMLILAMRNVPAPVRTANPSRPVSFYRQFTQGIHYIATHRRIMQVIGLMFMFWCCGNVIMNGLTGIITTHFHLSLQYYGYFMGLVGIGMVFGAASMSLAKKGIPKEIGIAWAMIVVGVFLLLFSLQSHWVPALLMLMIGSFGGAVLLVSLETLLQRIVPDYVRGRVMAVKDMINMFGLISVAIPLAFYSGIDEIIRYVLMGTSIIVGICGVLLLAFYYKRQNLPLFVSIMRRFSAAVLIIWHRFERVGACTIPTSGPVIVVANHTAGIDPVTLQISSPRRVIHFMMAKEYYEKWPWKYIYESFGAIPVNRNGNEVAAIKAALRLLEEKRVLGMFPEGGISLDGTLQAGKIGVAVLALRSGATVVPAYIDGANLHVGMLQDFSRRARLRVSYGKPLKFEHLRGQAKDKAVQEQVTAEIMAAIRKIRARLAPERDARESMGSANATRADEV